MKPILDGETLTFLKEHDLGVLSTIDRTGNIHGAVVYYIVGEGDKLYILTKSETQKAHNILAHNQLALTVYDANTLQTVQLNGEGEIEADQSIKAKVFMEIVKPRRYGNDSEELLPPVTTLHEGGYTIFRITPIEARFVDYKQR